MKKAVIFDMDGLMFDSERATYEAYIEICNAYGCEMTLEFYKKMLGRPIVVARQLLNEEFGAKFPVDEGIGKVHIWLEQRFQTLGVPKKKGLTEILEYIKASGMQAIVATSSDRKRVDKILQMAGVDGYFQDVICGNEIKNGKPAPDIFLAGCEKLGCMPQEAWVLEDSEAGVEAAWRAGIDCICVPDMKEPDEKTRKQAYCVVPSLLEAAEILVSSQKKQLD